jgi:uncharacterized protein
MRRHRIPSKIFTELAAGGGGAHAVEHLCAAQYSKRLLLLGAVRAVAVQGGAGGRGHDRLARQAFAQLSAIQRDAPDAVDEVVRYPTMGVWLRAAAVGETDAVAALTALTAAAAIRARHRRPVTVVLTAAGLTLPTVGHFALSSASDTAMVRAAPRGSVTVSLPGTGSFSLPADPARDAPHWAGLRRMDAEYHGMALRLSLDDCDPMRTIGAPDPLPRLSAAAVEWWRTALRRAWRLLVREHWTVAEESALLLRVLTPMSAPPHAFTTATAEDAFGALYLSRPPDDHGFAVTLAHEVQHAKLGALTDVVPLLRADDGTRFYAPWRDDPRPADGLLTGAYAHLGVAGYWRRQRRLERGAEAARAHTEFAHWTGASTLVTRTLLASGLLTSEGERFVAGMDRTLRAWLREPVPAAVLDRVQARATRHRAAWRARHGEPPPVAG